MSRRQVNKPFQCSICSRVFRSNSSRNTHIMMHTGERPFQCQQCDKKYVRNYQLKNHMTIHATHITAYHCKFCDLTVDDADFMEEHLKSHRQDADLVASEEVREEACAEKLTGCVGQNMESKNSKLKVQTVVAELELSGKSCSSLGLRDSVDANRSSPCPSIEILSEFKSRSVELKRSGQKGSPKLMSASTCSINSESTPLHGTAMDQCEMKVYLCEECDSGFSDLLVLQDHLQAYHGKSEFCK